MKNIVKGPFQVKSTPQPPDEISQKIGAMKMVFEKNFEGDLAMTSVVSMMGKLDQSIGSGGYVALELLTGTLAGRKGSFCLQHSCTMDQGQQSQTITVIPGTGTEELKGLKGSMTIDIADGKHFYTFEYNL